MNKNKSIYWNVQKTFEGDIKPFGCDNVCSPWWYLILLYNSTPYTYTVVYTIYCLVIMEPVIVVNLISLLRIMDKITWFNAVSLLSETMYILKYTFLQLLDHRVAGYSSVWFHMCPWLCVLTPVYASISTYWWDKQSSKHLLHGSLPDVAMPGPKEI